MATTTMMNGAIRLKMTPDCFEKICLEGFQAGLSWLTILRKRDNFRSAFLGFDIAKVADMDETDIERLVLDAGIVRHRGKIKSTINNANRALELQKEFGSLAAYFWGFEPEPQERPNEMTWDWLMKNPTSAQSTALSKDLKKRGWSFVGPTTVYAFMQAMGLVNDHVEGFTVVNPHKNCATILSGHQLLSEFEIAASNLSLALTISSSHCAVFETIRLACDCNIMPSLKIFS